MVEEKVSPYVAFMNECFVEDPEGPGVLAGAFLVCFQGWCREHRRHDLLQTTTGSLPD
jgi:hypothetical protein